jgi:hypothetical protein
MHFLRWKLLESGEMGKWGNGRMGKWGKEVLGEIKNNK